jgi:hypothetical protein
MIGQILPNNNETCYSNFSPIFHEVNTPCFDWSLPAKMRPEELDMETVVGATAKRRNQLHLVATPHDVRVES